jgi:hypothetical protein
VAFSSDRVFSAFLNTSLRLACRILRDSDRCLKHVLSEFLEFSLKTRFFGANTSLCAFFTHRNPMSSGEHCAASPTNKFRQFGEHGGLGTRALRESLG